VVVHGHYGRGMTPEQLEAVTRSAAVVAHHGDRFARRFYERLFELAPRARELFPTDLTEQRGKLVSELVFLVEAARDLPVFVDRARELGARHHRYGVRPGDYRVVVEALVAGLSNVLDGDFDDALEGAWRHLYWLIAETMLEGASGDVFAERH
jgi:hemoglobin-like flavoprotein